MWALFDYCKERYASKDLKSQTENMPAETRNSLAQKIVETLNDEGDVEDGDKVEGMLAKIEVDLEQANQQLKQLEDKEQFLSLRIRKYQEMLKEQDERMKDARQQQQQKAIADQQDAKEGPTEQEDQQRQEAETHYQEQLAKQQKNKEALGKVVDVHLTILKKAKVCKRTIAALEQKKYELSNVTKQCREFLVMAEEAEREQQLGMVHDDDDNDERDLLLVELATTNSNSNEEGSQKASSEDNQQVDTTTDVVNDDAPDVAADNASQRQPETTDEDGANLDLEAREPSDAKEQQPAHSPKITEESSRKETVPEVEPEELTGNNLWQN